MHLFIIRVPSKINYEGKNIWEHDINEAPDQWDDKFLALNSSHKKKYFPFAHAVVKGKWCFNFKYYLKKKVSRIATK